MSTRDYAAEDEALDSEIRALYAQDSESEATSEQEAPDESGTASEEQTQESNEDLQESTSSVDEIVQEQTEEPKKAVVDEERYKNAVKAMNRAQSDLAEYRKQDAARDQLIQQLQAQVQQLQEKQTTQAESTPDVDDSDLAEGMELYPEAVKPLLKKIAALEKKLAEVDDSVGNVKAVSDRFKQTEQQTAEDKYWDTIRSKHDDVDDLINDPSYLDWYPNQSPMIQQALQLKGTAKDVISALNLFRAEYPKTVHKTEVEQVAVKPVATKADKLAEARAASSPTIKSTAKPDQKKPTYTNAQIAKMSREEYMKHEAAIDEALARGEIY